MDGGSFAPLLLGQPACRRDFTLIEYESIQNAPGQTNEAMGARAATDSTNNTFRAIRWINASAVPPIDLLYAEFTNVLDPAGWHFEPAAVNYHELYHVGEDYFMLENVYASAAEEVKMALHEKLHGPDSGLTSPKESRETGALTAPKESRGGMKRLVGEQEQAALLQ